MKKEIGKPTESFGRLIKILRFFGWIVGCDFSDPNFRITTINWIWTFLTICFCLICTFLTILKKFKDDWTIILEALCMTSSVIQGATKFFFGLYYQKTVEKLNIELQNIYITYEKKSQRYSDALYKCCLYQHRVLKIMMFAFMFPCAAIVGLPLAILVLTGKRHLMMTLEVPGLDVETTNGYFGTIAIQLIAMGCGAFGLMAGDMLLLLYLIQPITYYRIFCLKIEDLNQLTANEESNEKEISEALIDIVKWYQDYSNFVSLTNEIMAPTISVGIISSAFSIALSLYMALASDWPGAYPNIVVHCYVLYYGCILGTKSEECNDSFTDEIYNISWYNLTISQQKIVKLMLLKSQYPSTINVAGVLPLSVSTALKITKSVYSMFMMMLEFVLE